jgi:hypothetical protein
VAKDYWLACAPVEVFESAPSHEVSGYCCHSIGLYGSGAS